MFSSFKKNDVLSCLQPVPKKTPKNSLWTVALADQDTEINGLVRWNANKWGFTMALGSCCGKPLGKPYLVASTPLKNVKVSWGYYSLYMDKKNVPNHQPNILFDIEVIEACWNCWIHLNTASSQETCWTSPLSMKHGEQNVFKNLQLEQMANSHENITNTWDFKF